MDCLSGESQFQMLSADFLQKVASWIHANKWKPIFRKLVGPYDGNVDVIIGDIEKNNQNDSLEQRYQALRIWESIVEVHDDEEKYKILKTTLQNHDCWRLDECSPSPGATSKPRQEHTGKYM